MMVGRRVGIGVLKLILLGMSLTRRGWGVLWLWGGAWMLSCGRNGDEGRAIVRGWGCGWRGGWWRKGGARQREGGMLVPGIG